MAFTLWSRWYPREVWKVWRNPQCAALDFLEEFWYRNDWWNDRFDVCPDSNHQRQPDWKVKGLRHLGWSSFGESCDEWEIYLPDGWSLMCSFPDNNLSVVPGSSDIARLYQVCRDLRRWEGLKDWDPSRVRPANTVDFEHAKMQWLQLLGKFASIWAKLIPFEQNSLIWRTMDGAEICGRKCDLLKSHAQLPTTQEPSALSWQCFVRQTWSCRWRKTKFVRNWDWPWQRDLIRRFSVESNGNQWNPVDHWIQWKSTNHISG